MSLTERDRLDLAASASGHGNTQSDNRARRLVETDPEAAEFVRQIKSICRAIQTHAEAESPPLAGEEADAIPAAILAVAKRRWSGAKFVLRHPWRWGAVAAAVAITFTTWFVFSGRTQPVVASAVFTSVSARLSPTRTSGSRTAFVRAGQLVETRGGYAVLTLTNNSRVVAVEGTNLIIQGTGQPIDLQQGALFIRAATTVQIRLGSAVISVDGDGSLAMVQITLNGPVCAVYTGRARIARQGHETQLIEGQLGAWSDAAEGVHTAALHSELPVWVKNALDTAAKP